MKNLTAAVVLLASVFCARTASAGYLSVSDDISDPLTLDPQRQFSEKNHTICQQIFDGLVRFDPDGKIEPALAVSWERLDATRMRFKLREGVTFHNGEPFDSSSVKFSIERYLDPATGFPARAFIDSIERVETPHQYTADIITKYSDGILLNRLAGFILISPPAYIKEKGGEYFASNPVGTGAFIFGRWEKGKQISLEGNKKYWMSGYPKIDGLIFKFIPQEKRLAALFSGEVDLITDLPGTQTLKLKSRPGFTVVKKASFYTVPPCLNLSSGPLSSVMVRKALNYALNKESLIRYDLLGNGKPIATFSMEGEVGHNAALRPYKFDLPKAKKLLADAGYPGGFSLKVLVKANAERTAKIIASNLKKAGVRLDITIVADADLLKEFSSKAYDMAIGGNPDPMYHSYFNQAIVLYSRSPFCLGGDPEFDKLLGSMVLTLEAPERAVLSNALDTYIYDNAMSLFTYQKIMVSGVTKAVRFVPSASGMPYFYLSSFK
jgi:peptide/nickel transport system substrate-binding protein